MLQVGKIAVQFIFRIKQPEMFSSAKVWVRRAGQGQERHPEVRHHQGKAYKTWTIHIRLTYTKACRREARDMSPPPGGFNFAFSFNFAAKKNF